MFGEVSDAIPLPSSFPLRRGERGRVVHVLEPFRRGRSTARRRRHRRPSLRLGGVSVDRRAATATATATAAADDPTDESPRRLKHRAQDSRGRRRRQRSRRRVRLRLRALRVALPRARLPVGLLLVVFARLRLERASRRRGRPPRGGSLDGGGGGARRGEDAGGFPRAALASSRPGRKRDRAKLLQRCGGAPSRRVSIIVRGRLRLRGRDGGLRLRGRDGGLRLRGRDSRGASCVASTRGSRRVGRRGPRGVTRHLRVGRRGRSGGGEAAEVARLRVAHGLGGARGVVVRGGRVVVFLEDEVGGHLPAEEGPGGGGEARGGRRGLLGVHRGPVWGLVEGRSLWTREGVRGRVRRGSSVRALARLSNLGTPRSWGGCAAAGRS